jgi:ankyrin repeat protein
MERKKLSSQTLWKLLTEEPRNELRLKVKLFGREVRVNINETEIKESPLHDAVAYGHPENVRDLIIGGNDIEVRSGISEETPIHWAAKLGRLECLKHLANYGGNLTAEDGSVEGNSTIHFAVIHGQEEITRWLLDNGVCVNTANKIGVTPLAYATLYGYTRLVQILVEKGANVNYQISGFNNATPLHLALRGGNQDVVRMLMNCGADPDILCSNNHTPVHWAALRGNLQNLKIMETYGAKLSIRTNDKCGYQPIHLAAGCGHTALVQWFLNNGAAVECPTNYGFTPLHLAAANGRTETAQLLLQRGAQVNKVNGSRT